MPPKKDSTAKSSKNAAAAATYQFRDVVLGKVKGYPAWPGMVVDPETVSQEVKAEQPKAQKTAVYCVRFFPKGDHAWLTAKDISRLLPHEIDGYIAASAKKPMLKEGYEIARDPTPWEKSLAEGLVADDDDEDAQDDAMEVDELDDEGAKPKKKSAPATKKRKRDGETKSAPKKEPASKKGRGAKGKKSKETVESEDDGDAEADAEEERTSKKSKTEVDAPEIQKVKDWRHKLQKGFLSKDKGPPTDEDLVALDALMKTVEDYNAMTLDQLTTSKIGKVMRHIAALSDDKIPKDDVYRFRTRSDELVQKWSVILNPKGEANGTANGTNEAEPLSAIV